jgi:hypothetical protein
MDGPTAAETAATTLELLLEGARRAGEARSEEASR